MKHPVLRLLSIVLLLTLTSSLFPALAAEASVKIGDQLFFTLSDAAAQAQPGDVIELLTDCTISQTVTLPSGITLDGGHHQLTLGSTACLQASGDLILCNLSVLINRSTRSVTPILLSGEHAQYQFDNLSLRCPDVARMSKSTELLTFSAKGSTLTMENCQFFSFLNQTTALLLTGDCSGSTISLTRSDIHITPQSGTPRKNFAITANAAGAPTLLLDNCVLEASTAAVAIAEDQANLEAVLTNCQLLSANPLYIAGSSGSYELSDCTLSDAQTDAGYECGLLRLDLAAQDNTVSISDTALDSGTQSTSACVFSIQNTQNDISMSDHTAVSTASNMLDLIHVRDEISIQSPVYTDDSVDLSAFPVTWRNADGLVCNASTSLSAAAPLWQPGDTITLRGAVSGAIDLQVPVTILGENASFSGSLAIRAPGTTIHELDLSNSTIDCTTDCDLSLNYWGAQFPPANAAISPLYTDADLTELIYAQVPDDQADQEIDYFISQVQDILSQSVPGCTLESFDPLTDGDALTDCADELLALCERLSQSTTSTQRDTILSASPSLNTQMKCAWRVYWAAVGCNAANSTVELSAQLTPPVSDTLRALMTQNTAANHPVLGVSVDGTTVNPTDEIFVHSTVTKWEMDSLGRVQSVTFQTELRTGQGTVVPGDGTYRLPLPAQDCESIQATINQSTATLSPEYSAERYAYVTLSELGTIKLTLTYAPEQPDQPDEPDVPTEPDNPTTPTEPEETLYTVTLRGGSHGTLRLRTASEAAQGETVKITIIPDDGYILDTLDVVNTNGRSIDFDLSGETLRFTMPASDVRVTARFVLDQSDLPQESVSDELIPPADVAADAWYQDAVLQVIEPGFMTPLLIGQFCPDLPASRGDLITALYRMAGTPAAYAPAFTDIPSDSAYYEASIWARAAGIAMGEPDGRFRPYDTVTREECVALLYRFCGNPPTEQTALPFSDFLSISDWARPAMCWAYQSGILHGNTEGTCTPLAAVTRAEAAALLMRLLQ